MNGKDTKRSRGRRSLYCQSKSSNNGSRFQPLTNCAARNICDVATDFAFNLNSLSEDAEKIMKLVDEPQDLDIPAHALSKGPNPYLDRCINCNTPRTEAHEGDEGTEFLDVQLGGNAVINSPSSPQSFNSLKLEIWTCPACRKVVGNFQSILEANLSQASSCDEKLPNVHTRLSCLDPMLCKQCTDERVSNEHWTELRQIVKEIHDSTVDPVLTEEQGDRLMHLIDILCQKDPHQLFLRLESQVREMVTDIKKELLEKLGKGCNMPDLALDFTSSLLSHYELCTKKSSLLAQYLGGLTDHLKQFQVTWELLNKHLFHSIAHNDPAISSVGPTILEQLRQGSLQYEKSKEDPFCNVRKRLLKFQKDMSVVVVVWRECQQLIENYCQEEVKNTQKELSNKARSFISQQRQFLTDHIMKDSFMDAETMKTLLSGYKSSTEKELCHRCKRERCKCDECTFTHMITCGIINSDKAETLAPPSSFNFALDPTRNVMDITPPSMSSTTSSSGSVSPINVDDKNSSHYDCGRILSDAMLFCVDRDRRYAGLSLDDLIDNIDGNVGDDEEEEDDLDDNYAGIQESASDEPHTLQLPLWEAVQCQARSGFDPRVSAPHSCAQCHQFQPPIDSHLSKQLEAELANSSLAPGVNIECLSENILQSASTESETVPNGDSLGNSNVCATCQCHACLKQSGHVISTSLPLQVPVSPPPAELLLYPHIHGLPPQRYMYNLPSLMPPLAPPLMPPIKVKVDFDDTSGSQTAFSDGDYTMSPRPGSLAAQHQHQRLSGLSTDLRALAPHATNISPFQFDSVTLATHTTQTSTTNTTSVFKAVAGKQVESSLLSNLDKFEPEGSSVDPTTKPVSFPSLIKIPPSCINSAFSVSGSLSNFSSPLTTTVSSFSNHTSVTTTSSSKMAGSCHGPPCSRPTPVGGNSTFSRREKIHLQQCKQFIGSGSVQSVRNKQSPSGFLGQPHRVGGEADSTVNPFSPIFQPPASFANNPSSLKNPLPDHHSQEVVLKTLCSHAPNPPVRGCESPTFPQMAVGTNSSSSSMSSSFSTTCVNASSALPSMVNNVGVGTTTPCVDLECRAHHNDDNCDSIDDSCSEKSSSTSTSTQKEGKYCDCCYCELFGHNNTQTTKTNTSITEIKDRLRKKLVKRQSESQHKPIEGMNGVKPFKSVCNDDGKDPLEKKGLEGLLSYINGTEDGTQGKKEKVAPAKAAKRARQKQRKLEEKARSEKVSHRGNHLQNGLEPEMALRQFLIEQSLAADLRQGLPSKANFPKPEMKCSKEDNSLKDLPSKLMNLQSELTRSSLIIESTRPTLRGPSPKVLSNNNSKEASQDILDMLQSLKQQSQQQAQKPSNGKKAPPPFPISMSSKLRTLKNDGIISIPKTINVRDMSRISTQHQAPQRTQPALQQQQMQQQNLPPPSLKIPVKSDVGKLTSQMNEASNKTTNSSSRISNGDGKPQAINGHPTQITTGPVGKAPSCTSVADSPGAGSCNSASQSLSSGTKLPPEQAGKTGKSKKNKKKKNGDGHALDEVFIPKSESELEGDVDDFERELEEFKRFCFEPTEPRERRKIGVNVNLKDIFKKKTAIA